MNKDLDEQVRLLGAVNLCMASEPAELHVLLSQLTVRQVSVGAPGNVFVLGKGSVTEVVTVNLNFGKFRCWDPGVK